MLVFLSLISWAKIVYPYTLGHASVLICLVPTLVFIVNISVFTYSDCVFWLGPPDLKSNCVFSRTVLVLCFKLFDVTILLRALVPKMSELSSSSSFYSTHCNYNTILTVSTYFVLWFWNLISYLPFQMFRPSNAYKTVNSLLIMNCSRTDTPLWRNGPPEKPVLCNACGSRWRTKGTLANYTPLHARAEPDDYEDHRFSRMKNVTMNKNKEMKIFKKKPNQDSLVNVGDTFDYNQGFRKFVDEDTSNRSSSGSAISISESCGQFGSADVSDFTGPAQANVWDTSVPSRKRTCVSRSKPTSVAKLTKDLFTILQEQQSSCFSGSSDEDLIFDTETSMVSVEIGHGSVLMRHPASIARDEESEASSLSVENKYMKHDVNSCSSKLLVNSDVKSVNFSNRATEKPKNPPFAMQHDQIKRNKSLQEKIQTMGGNSSPLCNVDMNDILNFDEFVGRLTHEEQDRLMKLLPLADVARLPDSLSSMFESSQFKENLYSFQQLLAEGVFDVSFSEAKTEDYKTLKRLVLGSFKKSNWVESYHQIKKCKNSSGGSTVVRGLNAVASNGSINGKRSRDTQNQNIPEAMTMIRSPKRVMTKPIYENKELVDNDNNSCFSPTSLFAIPPEYGNSLHFFDESSDQDILLDVPSNNSFPQAELLHPMVNFGKKQASISCTSVYPPQLYP